MVEVLSQVVFVEVSCCIDCPSLVSVGVQKTRLGVSRFFVLNVNFQLAIVDFV